MAIDADGNLYIADTTSFTVRKVSPSGEVTTFAGSPGEAGQADGGGPDARFTYPTNVAVDATGNVYVVDVNITPESSSDDRLRKISPLGVVSTVRTIGFSVGGMLVAPDGTVFVMDNSNSVLRKIALDGTMTAFTGQDFYSPGGVTLAPDGNFYVADSSNRTVDKVTPEGVVTTLAGSPETPGSNDGTGSEARFEDPSSIVATPDGNLFVTDKYAVRKVTPAGVVTTFAGAVDDRGSVDGSGTEARFLSFGAIAADSAGNLFVTDLFAVRKITPAGVVTTFAGARPDSHDGVGAAAGFVYPHGITRDAAGNLYVSDSSAHTIRKVTPGGVVTTIAGSNGMAGSADGTGSAASFNGPRGLGVDGAGNLYVADTENDTIRKITPAGIVTTLAGQPGVIGSEDGTGPAAHFSRPYGLAATADGTVYVADSYNYTIRKITAGGVVTTLAGKARSSGWVDDAGPAARFRRPYGVEIESSGNLLVLDSMTGHVRRVTLAGAVTTITQNTISGTGAFGYENYFDYYYPYDVAVDPSGNIFVSDFQSGTIQEIQSNGVAASIGGFAGILTDGDGVGHRATFGNPDGIVADSTGSIYIVDSSAGTIRKGSPAPAYAIDPTSLTASSGDTLAFTAATSGDSSLPIQWLQNGSPLAGETSPNLTIDGAVPGDAGLYSLRFQGSPDGRAGNIALVGMTTSDRVSGAGKVLATNVLHPNGNHFDQVLLTGAAELVTAAPTRVTRTSFIDDNGDIVQVEFSGPGTLSIVLAGASGPAMPEKYTQDVSYMKGHAGIVIAGATEQTNVSVFCVGRATAFDLTGAYNILLAPGGTNDPAHNGSPLFAGQQYTYYDSLADIAFIAIASTNGKFGGIRTANARYSADSGFTGIYAPGVAFTGPIFIGELQAKTDATPIILVGAVSDARITGGNLLSHNNSPIQVSGLTHLKFTAGLDASGQTYPAAPNAAVLIEDGQDVTSRIVVNP